MTKEKLKLAHNLKLEINTVKEIAKNLIEILLKEGFVIQRYDAYSTNSIYLKLDYGVCNSIRISDHTGKKNLSYRYNIGMDIKQYYQSNDRYTRYFFPYARQCEMIELILKDRDEKISRYGIENYKKYMQQNKKSNKEKRGFWQGCKLIQRD